MHVLHKKAIRKGKPQLLPIIGVWSVIKLFNRADALLNLLIIK